MQKCHLMYGTKYSLLLTEEEHDEDVKMLKKHFKLSQYLSFIATASYSLTI